MSFKIFLFNIIAVIWFQLERSEETLIDRMGVVNIASCFTNTFTNSLV